MFITITVVVVDYVGIVVATVVIGVGFVVIVEDCIVLAVPGFIVIVTVVMFLFVVQV